MPTKIAVEIPVEQGAKQCGACEFHRPSATSGHRVCDAFHDTLQRIEPMRFERCPACLQAEVPTATERAAVWEAVRAWGVALAKEDCGGLHRAAVAVNAALDAIGGGK